MHPEESSNRGLYRVPAAATSLMIFMTGSRELFGVSPPLNAKVI